MPIRSNWSNSAEFLWLVALALFFLSKINVFFDEFAVSDDASQHLFWLHDQQEQVFKVGNPIVKVAQDIQPFLFNRIYIILTTFLSIKMAWITVEFVIFVSIFAMLMFFFRRFYKAESAYLLFPVVVFVILPDIEGGFARSFGLLCILLPFYAHLKFKNAYLTALAAGVGAFLYPVAFLISCTSMGLLFLIQLLSKEETQFHFRSGVALVLCVIPILIYLQFNSKQIHQNPLLGPSLTGTEIATLPELSDLGRAPLRSQFETTFPIFIVKEYAKALNKRLSYFGFTPNVKFSVMLITGLILGWLFLLWRSRTGLDSWLLAVLLAGLVLAFAAQLLPFLLYQPVRYLEKTILIVVFLSLPKIVEQSPLYPRVDIALKVVAFSLCFLALQGVSKFYSSFAEYAPVYEFALKTEPESVFAAPPVAANMIPYFGKRSVLVSEESAHLVYFKHQREMQMNRMSDLITLYSTSNVDTVKRIIAKYELNYIVFDSNEFSNTSKVSRLFEPFGNRIETLNNRDHFASSYLNAMRNSSEVVINKRFSVLSLRKDDKPLKN